MLILYKEKGCFLNYCFGVFNRIKEEKQLLSDTVEFRGL